MDKANPADWSKIKPKSIITISDAQAIADSMRRKLGVRGIDYTVQSVARCDQLDGLSTHLLITLSDPEQSTYLLVKIVDDLIDLYLFFEPDGLPSGSRPELLDRGCQWLFQAPPNPDSFNPSELRYTMSIRQSVPPPDGRGTPQELTYVQKSQGELQCNYSENPPRQGLPQQMLATLVEYRTTQPTENPELLVLEVGEQRSDRSFVRFFLGCTVKPGEVDVLGL